MTLLLFAEDHQVGYDGYKSRLRTKRVANGLICGQAECCGNYRGVSLRTPGCCGGLRGRLRTTMLAFCGLWGRIRPHIVL